jgi:glycosyltransferase involved in cell wall biosynthesis
MTRVLLNMPSQFAGRPSGVARMAFSLIEHLLHNPEFTYILRSPWTQADLPQPLITARLEVITTRRPSFIVFDVIRQSLLMPLFCRRKDIDLLVNLDPFGAPRGGHARVMLVHDLYFRAIQKQVGRREVLTTDLIHRLMLANHDAVVTMSNATKCDLARWYPSSISKSTTIHSGLTLQPVTMETGSSEIDGPYVLAVGNATKNKNFLVLGEAMTIVHRTLPSVALVHVGDDPRETIGFILSKLRSRVRLIRLSRISDRRLAQLYRGASCLCVPSLCEGFCLPILEAQALNCPVICSDCSAMPEIAGSGALIFDPKSPEALAEAIVTLLSNPRLREELVKNGRENLLRFSWEKAAAEYEEVFRQTLANNGRLKGGRQRRAGFEVDGVCPVS